MHSLNLLKLMSMSLNYKLSGCIVWTLCVDFLNILVFQCFDHDHLDEVYSRNAPCTLN